MLRIHPTVTEINMKLTFYFVLGTSAVCLIAIKLKTPICIFQKRFRSSSYQRARFQKRFLLFLMFANKCWHLCRLLARSTPILVSLVYPFQAIQYRTNLFCRFVKVNTSSYQFVPLLCTRNKLLPSLRYILRYFSYTLWIIMIRTH